MFDRDFILKKIGKPEDKLIVAKILDKANRAEKSRSITHTDFLDPYQKNLVEKYIAGNDDMEYTLNGGYSGAEREVAFFRPSFIYEEFEDIELPIKAAVIHPKSRETLTHRDYLGALMGLGIKREKIGDILVKDESCSIIVLQDIADFIGYILLKVGNTRVETEICEISGLEILEPKIREIKGTVASPRLDSVSSLGFSISRSKIADFIRSERVSLNWEITGNLTKQVKEGDVISIRGKGRVEVVKLGTLTKKGRISTILKKFI